MDSKKSDDDIEIIADNRNVVYNQPNAYVKASLKNFQLPNLSDEDLEILELPPPQTIPQPATALMPPLPEITSGVSGSYYNTRFRQGRTGETFDDSHVTSADYFTPPAGRGVVTCNEAGPVYYEAAVARPSLNLFDSFASTRVGAVAPDPAPNPYHELMAENHGNGTTCGDRQPIPAYTADRTMGCRNGPTVVPYPPSFHNTQAGRQDHLAAMMRMTYASRDQGARDTVISSRHVSGTCWSYAPPGPASRQYDPEADVVTCERHVIVPNGGGIPADAVAFAYSHAHGHVMNVPNDAFPPTHDPAPEARHQTVLSQHGSVTHSSSDGTVYRYDDRRPDCLPTSTHPGHVNMQHQALTTTPRGHVTYRYGGGPQWAEPGTDQRHMMMEVSRDGSPGTGVIDSGSSSIVSCSPTSSLSSNGFASPEETEGTTPPLINGLPDTCPTGTNPPDSSTLQQYHKSDDHALLASSSSTSVSGAGRVPGRRNGRPPKSAAVGTKGGAVSSTSGRRKKKRDPNEPQKPVSAYALFFRDTQAAIKGQNPTATFGEVSKIVASMWDSLDTDRKDVYKKKTELAKKEYLKKLSEYRAKVAAKNKVATATPKPTMNTVGNCEDGAGGTGKIDPAEDDKPIGLLIRGGGTASFPQASAHDHVMEEDGEGEDEERLSAETAYINSFNVTKEGGTTIGDVVPSLGVGSGAGAVPQCSAIGCDRDSVPNPEWDDRYCGNECVVRHCKDVFSAWVASRQKDSVNTVANNDTCPTAWSRPRRSPDVMKLNLLETFLAG